MRRPPTPLAVLRAHAGAFAEERGACARALASSHLVTVAAKLVRRPRATLEDLRALGVPVDLLAWFPRWREGSRAGFAPGASGLRLAPRGATFPLGALRIQLSPHAETVSHALGLLRGVLHATDRDVRVAVVVEPGSDVAALRGVIARIAPRSVDRVHLAELAVASVFAQDNGIAMQDAEGRPLLLVPRAFRRDHDRAADDMTEEAASRALGVPVVRSRLFWEGGNLVHDDETALVGVDTIAENVARLGLSAREVTRAFEVELGRRVIPLGDPERAVFGTTSGQVSFHIDLDVSLLGRVGRGRRARRRLALVADPARGLDYLPHVLARAALFRGHFLPPREARAQIEAHYDAYARARHAPMLAYATALERAGYRVVGMPDLRIDPAENVFAGVNLDFGYCNVLPGLHRGRPAVHHMAWGIAALDEDAAAQLARAGLAPVRVATPAVANGLMRLHGGLRCACGSLA
jgi:hypothetical protein